MQKLMCIDVRGKRKNWSFNFCGDTRYLREWREDGLQIDEVINIIPEWVVWLGMTKVWCWLQDKGFV